MTTIDGWTPAITHEVRTLDGRLVKYCLYGPEDGRPVIAHDGTPGSRFCPPTWVEALTGVGARVLAFDRAGYGGSTRLPGRSVADVAADVALLADSQGWHQFGTWGVSGGGPHALATAALLPDRVTRCAAVVSPAPYAATDSDVGLVDAKWFDGMSPGNVEEFTLARKGEAEYRPLVERLGGEAVAQAERGELAHPPGYDLPESDLEEMRRRLAGPQEGRLHRVRAAWLAFDGWIDDCIAFTKPWGVNLARIGVPVTIWYGPDDVLCPRAHSEWLLSHVPGAQGHELSGGHMQTEETMAGMLRWVSGQDA